MSGALIIAPVAKEPHVRETIWAFTQHDGDRTASSSRFSSDGNTETHIASNFGTISNAFLAALAARTIPRPDGCDDDLLDAVEAEYVVRCGGSRPVDENGAPVADGETYDEDAWDLSVISVVLTARPLGSLTAAGLERLGEEGA